MRPTTVESSSSRGRASLAAAADLRLAIARATRPGSVASVLEPLNELLTHLANVRDEGELFAEVHPDVTAREEAERLSREAASAQTELHQDRAVYEALASVEEPADPLARRARELSLRDMRRAGVELGDVDRRRAAALRDALVELEQEFARNIRDDVRSLTCDPEELEGLPDDYRSAHAPGADGTVRITTDYPDFVPFLAYARSEGARKTLMTKSHNRATPRNVEVLRELLARRWELARLLGYASWADYTTADKMCGSAANAWAFIDRAHAAAAQRARAEIAALLEAKRRDDPHAEAVGLWDVAHYTERVKTARYEFDSKELRPYFEYGRTRAAVLDLAAELFGLAFTPIADAGAWHSSVETFDVAVDGAPAGRISLDMHPREGKRKHNSCFDLRTGVGGVQSPHVVLVCNFADPQSGPALMQHSEVVTFFHEVGHLVHHLVAGAAPWVRLAHVAERDFVEAPSQLLEEWIFDAGVLGRFARHERSGAPIPAELVARLAAARDFGSGVFVQRQLFLAAVSLAFHDRDPREIDIPRVMSDLAARYSPCILPPDTRFEASFGHLEQYTATYYTYMWSLALAKDLATAFGDDLGDVPAARRYRDLVVAPGGTKPADVLMRDFLGRPREIAAFEDWLRPTASAPVSVR